MKYLRLLAIAIMVCALMVSCGKKKGEMTVEDFSKIEMETITTDMKPETIETVAKKYGYTLKQYKDFEEKVQQDPKLQEKLGEIRLQKQKKAKQ